MEKLRIPKEELERAREWARDESWVRKKEYERDLGYLACVQDILEHSVFQSMDQFIQHGSTTCKAHCIQVSYMTYKICKARGWDYVAGARAGLLHDLFLYDWHTHAKETGEHFHGLTHPRVAMNNAVRYFHITDKEKDMILRHMWPLTPIPPRSKEGFVILYADKFCGLAEVATQMKKQVMLVLQPGHLG
ncbi:MAG: HD family phosphohydrolase [Hungatella sp.]|nr:HD family phosphohydrolase [Hungatella sp.]